MREVAAAEGGGSPASCSRGSARHTLFRPPPAAPGVPARQLVPITAVPPSPGESPSHPALPQPCAHSATRGDVGSWAALEHQRSKGDPGAVGMGTSAHPQAAGRGRDVCSGHARCPAAAHSQHRGLGSNGCDRGKHKKWLISHWAVKEMSHLGTYSGWAGNGTRRWYLHLWGGGTGQFVQTVLPSSSGKHLPTYKHKEPAAGLSKPELSMQGSWVRQHHSSLLTQLISPQDPSEPWGSESFPWCLGSCSGSRH